MAMNRSQFPELMGYDEGGLISSFDVMDPFETETGFQINTAAPQVTRLSENTDEPKDFAKDLELQLRAIEAARKMKPLELEKPEFDFGAEFDDYQERLKKLLGKPAPVTFFLNYVCLKNLKLNLHLFLQVQKLLNLPVCLTSLALHLSFSFFG